ncbi:MAG: hypothetical protein R3E66_12520 [bacterium]
MIELNKQPYREYVELLEELRRDESARDWVAFDKVVADGRGTYDANEQERARVVHVLYVDPGDDLDLVRFLLDQEIAARRADSFQGAGDVLTMLSLRLLVLGDASDDDIWRFWSAKCANFDTLAGGYDIEFVFAQRPYDEVRQLVQARGTAKNVAFFDKYDGDAIVSDLPAWRTRLVRNYPTSLADFTYQDAASWAELFGDTETYEHYSLLLAGTAQDRANLYRRLERFDAAVDQWRLAAEAATTDWDRAAMLQRLISDAAQVPIHALEEVAQLDALRPNVAEWNDVGLGRMATQACYELAAATRDASAGPTIWKTAERWRKDLSSFTLVGLQAAVAAAEKWGEPYELEALRQAVRAEQARINELLG